MNSQDTSPDTNAQLTATETAQSGQVNSEGMEQSEDTYGVIEPTTPDLRAVCDRCNSRISGTRHKCQDCPDFDYCSKCFTEASLIHPGHSFASILGTGLDEASEAESKDECGNASPNSKLVQDSVLETAAIFETCQSCAPVTRPLPALPLIIRENGIPRNRQISLRWQVRISKLIEATQRGCAFCCYCLTKFFGPSNFQAFSYEPEKPWYSEPSKHDKKRADIIEHCMKTLTRLKSDVFEFHVNPICSRKGTSPPDFDQLDIGLDEATNKIHDVKNLQGVFNSAGNIHVKVDVFAAKGDPAAACVSNRPPNPSPASPEAILQIKDWMKECDEKHGEACQPPGPSRLPSRLIDVSGGDKLRLHKTENGETGQYISLSYCWGGPQEFSTKLSTLSDRLAGFSIDDLPKTLQDAVRVTQNLGVQYIWIDSMCIIQDNEEDKAHQVSHMASIYRNSYLTICAARASKVTDGFLKSCADSETGLWKGLIPMVLPIPNKDAQTVEEGLAMPSEGMGTLWLMDEDRAFRNTFQDPTSKRGWCLQEKILPPRLISYGRWPMWRCNRAVLTDGGFYPHDEKTISDERQLVHNIHNIPSNGADLFTTNQLQKSWRNLLNDYTKRELGLDDDRLPAIGGIATEISRIIGVGYAAGLWKNNLLYDLMWYADTREWMTRPEAWRAPSWSWASVNCPVSYGDITDDAAPLARVLSCNVVQAPDSSAFGRVEGGTLEIEGPFIELERNDVLSLFGSQDLAPPPPRSNDVSEWYSQMLEHIANQPEQQISKEEVEAALPNKVYGLITFTRDWMQQYESRMENRCYFGVLLREAEHGRYERIGAFFNENSDWLDQEAIPWPRKRITIV